MIIKDFLSQAFYIDRSIAATKYEIERLRLLAESIPTPDLTQDVVQRSDYSDRVAKTVVAIVDLEQELQNEINSYIQVKSEIHRVIEAVEKPKLKLILQERYLNFKKWEQIQEILEVSDLRYLFRLHNRALKEAIKRNPTNHCFTI